MMRYARLAPPPRCRVVILPWLLRPACFCNLTTRDFSGFVFVISSKVETDMPRRPGDVGLYCLIGIFSTSLCLQSVDRLAFTQGDNRFFPLACLFRSRGRTSTPPVHHAFLAGHTHGIN